MNPKQSKTGNNSVIQVGIDLGTTNSEVAINNSGKVEIIKNAQQDEYTPSVFGIDKSNNKVVGRKAYDKLFKSSSEEEFNNYKAEIKRLMGTDEKVHFQRTNEDLTPEEVSSEILKSLREDINRKYSDFNTKYAVITVPAYFSSLQAEATKRAGELAGFKYVVLLQEPIAAAISYGFDNISNQNWLVYDLGGGTFDVALISSKDGVLTVLGHNGNNFLGGKDFDWLIVDEIIKPAILEKYKLKTFDRSNDDLKIKSIFARLKAIAESAKIELSQYDHSTIEVEDIGKDEEGKEIYISIDISRDKFEQLIKSKVDETISLTQKTLKESGIQPSAVSKIVLVGGPTQIPFIKSSLEEVFKLTIDNSVDPLTIVARGACLFGLSQRIPQETLSEDHTKTAGEVHVSLNYDSMTSEEEQTITGIVEELKDSDDEYYIQIQSDNGAYTSSKIKLKNGKFFDTISISKGSQNVFWLYLFDKEGESLPIYPDSFSVTHGLTVSGAPIPHTIGVVFAEKSINSDFQYKEVCDPYFEKNSNPPLKETRTYHTLSKLEKGKDNQLPIKVYEGESDNPSRNSVITELSIDGKKLPYDLPANSEVDLTISVDESRSISVEAYLPSVELTINVRVDKYSQKVDTEALDSGLQKQRSRLKSVEKNISKDQHDEIEGRINELSTNIKNAGNDTDDKNKAERDLRELESKLDEIEKSKELPQLKSEFNEVLENAEQLVGNLPDTNDKGEIVSQLNILKREGQKALDDEDRAILARVIEQLRGIAIRALAEDPSFWVWQLNEIRAKQSEFNNKTDGEYYLNKADKAVQENDVEELKRCVRELVSLLPEESQEEITSNMSGITR